MRDRAKNKRTNDRPETNVFSKPLIATFIYQTFGSAIRVAAMATITLDSSVGRAVDCSTDACVGINPSVTGSIPVREILLDQAM